MNTLGSAGVPAGIQPKADVPVGPPNHAVPSAPGNADVPVGPPSAPRQWYSRGYIPHRDEPHLLQSISYRLADSLPQEKLRALDDELRSLPEDQRDAARRRKIETWLDAGMGCCALRHPAVAGYVQNSFLHFHGERYHLHAWCIMPNHVHILIEPLTDLATIVQSWKSFTARWALARNAELELGVPGENFWMREYWDRYIRDEYHYRKVVDYIHQNPVSAGLCATPDAWPWSSAAPGSAGVPAGMGPKADEDVGAPTKSIASSSAIAP